MKIELTKRHEIKILTVCMLLLSAAAGWLILTRPAYRIEGDFLLREDRRAADDWLAEQLKSPVAEHRARSCLAFGRIGHAETLDLLLTALRDPAPRVRVAAAFAIGQMEDRDLVAELGREPQPPAAQALIAALDDPERVVVARAVEALGRLRWQPAIPHLLRTAAPLPVTMTALVRLGDPEVIPWIAARRRSDDQETRWAATLALLELGATVDAEITRSFLNLTKDLNPWIRAAAVRGLGRAEPSREVLRVLNEMTSDRDPKVRMEALGSLGELGSPDSLSVLVTGLGDPNESVSLRAVDALAALGNPEALPLLQSLRFKPTPLAYRAERAVAALAQRDEDFFAGRNDVPEAYRNQPGMEGFVAALGLYRSAASAEWLTRLWRTEPLAGFARPFILKALAAQKFSGLAPYLDEAVNDPDHGLRQTALEVIAEPSVELCEAAYQRAAAGSASAVRLAALDAASRIGPSARQKRFLLAALDDEDRLVRIRAVKYLRLLHREDYAKKIGPAHTRYEPEDYQRIARTLTRRIRMETSIGLLEIALDYKQAPLTAENFAALARQGFFDGQRFVAAVPNAFVKAGDPRGDGLGGPGYTIRSEINAAPFLRGSLAMAGDAKDSGGSQFLICLSPQPLWDGRYTNFGRLVSGDEVLDRITTETRILRVVVP